MHISLKLNWKIQYEVMINKIQEAIDKLFKTTMHTATTHLYFNAYLLKSMCFGCGIIELSRLQEEKLRKIHKETILAKIGLSIKSYYTIIYVRKIALGLGLIKPSTAVKIQMLKQYIEYKQMKSWLSKVI